MFVLAFLPSVEEVRLYLHASNTMASTTTAQPAATDTKTATAPASEKGAASNGSEKAATTTTSSGGGHIDQAGIAEFTKQLAAHGWSNSDVAGLLPALKAAKQRSDELEAKNAKLAASQRKHYEDMLTANGHQLDDYSKEMVKRAIDGDTFSEETLKRMTKRPAETTTAAPTATKTVSDKKQAVEAAKKQINDVRTPKANTDDSDDIDDGSSSSSSSSSSSTSKSTSTTAAPRRGLKRPAAGDLVKEAAERGGNELSMEASARDIDASMANTCAEIMRSLLGDATLSSTTFGRCTYTPGARSE
jgi:hypothetical protein